MSNDVKDMREDTLRTSERKSTVSKEKGKHTGHRRKHGWGWGMEGGRWRDGERGKVVETEVKNVMRSRKSCKGWCFLWMGSQQRVLNEVSNMIWLMFLTGSSVLSIQWTKARVEPGTHLGGSHNNPVEKLIVTLSRVVTVEVLRTHWIQAIFWRQSQQDMVWIKCIIHKW